MGDDAGHGSICWTELNTWDPEKAKSFYAQVLGWTFSETPSPEGGVYHLAHTGGEDNPRMVCGLFQLTEPMMTGVPEHWFSYFRVDDVDAAVDATIAAGGAVVRPPWDIPNVGRIAIVKDANGAALGLMT